MSYHKSSSARNIEYFNEGYHPHLGYLADYNQFQISMPNGHLVSKFITEGKELSYIKHWMKQYGKHTVDRKSLFEIEVKTLTRGEIITDKS